MLAKIIRRLRARFITHVTYRGIEVPVHGPHVIRPIKEELMTGRYEVPEITALQALLRPGDRMLEIGGGLGVVSALAARAMPDVTIESYEANPALIAAIDELHKKNGLRGIALHNRILVQGGGGGERAFHLHRSFAESSVVPGEGKDRSVAVPTEDFAAKLGSFRPHVLVVDIEGGEDELLSGADLAGLRAMVLELHPRIIDRAAEKRIFDACAAAGLYPRYDLSTANVVAFERVD
ncbi:MAG: FkbM family methyltransferase [Roseovarius sp.]|nr:FkbM family methyltransferase [Roseovarius sp.]